MIAVSTQSTSVTDRQQTTATVPPYAYSVRRAVMNVTLVNNALYF